MWSNDLSIITCVWVWVWVWCWSVGMSVWERVGMSVGMSVYMSVVLLPPSSLMWWQGAGMGWGSGLCLGGLICPPPCNQHSLGCAEARVTCRETLHHITHRGNDCKPNDVTPVYSAIASLIKDPTPYFTHFLQPTWQQVQPILVFTLNYPTWAAFSDRWSFPLRLMPIRMYT